jgi:hypothetical protein
MAGKSGAVRAGGAFVELFSDDSKLARGLKAAGGKLKSWGKDVSSIGRGIFEAGAVVKTAFAGATAMFAEVGAELAHMSERTGIGVSSLSQLKYAADQSGVGMDDFETSIKKMQKTLGQASIGNKQAQQSLRALGLDINSLINLSPEQQLEAIAAAIASIPNPAQRAAAAISIFGKNGTAILPLLLKGADGIQELKREADALGLTMSKEDAQAAVELQKAMKMVWATLRGVAVAVGSALAPSMTDLAKRAATVIGNVVNWIKENRGLIVTVSAAATALMVVGAAITGVGYAISFLAPAFAGLGMAVSAVGAVMGIVVSVVGAILSPIGLVIAAVVGLGGYFLATSGIIQSVVASLSESFSGLSEETSAAFDAIKTAMSAGDFQAAAQVLWAYLKVEWERGIEALNGAWDVAKVYFLDLWTNATADLAKILATTWEGLAAGFYQAVAAMTEAWAALAKTMIDLMAPVFTSVAGKIGYIAAKIAGADDKTAQFAGDVTGATAGGLLGGGKDAIDKQVAAARANRDKALADYNSGDTGTAIDEDRARRLAANRAGTGAGKNNQAEQDLAAARANLALAVAAANAAKTRPGAAISAAADASDDAIAAASKSGKAVGTFSSSRLEGLGGKSGFDKLADNASKTNGHLQTANNLLDQIQKNTQNYGTSFS